MKNNQEKNIQNNKSLRDSFINEGKIFQETKTPIYKGCPNMGQPCFCPGTCREVIGYEDKIPDDLNKLRLKWKK